jgi:tellurite resistance protein TerB
MAFWDKVKSVTAQAAAQLKATTSELTLRLSEEVSKYKNKDFLVAVVTACVFVALADNNISAEEREALGQFLKISQELKVFDADDVFAEFERAKGLFAFGYALGETEALARIRKIKGNEGAARTLVRVVVNLANSDGDFSKDERNAVSKIATELGLNPAEFLPA